MKKNLIPFLCGALTAAVCMTTAMAGASYSGRISFNTNSLYLNGVEILRAGESMTTEAGAQVPTSILYTDENGGGTYYVPVRPLSQALDIPVTWNEDAVLWRVEGELAVNLYPETSVGTVYDDYIQTVEAVVPEGGTELLREEYTGVDNFETALTLRPDEGNTVSVTVTNRGVANVVFRLGIQKDDTKMTGAVKVPAGETVPRTFRVLPGAESDAVPYLEIGNGKDVYRENSFTVTAVQFDAEYPAQTGTGA